MVRCGEPGQWGDSWTQEYEWGHLDGRPEDLDLCKSCTSPAWEDSTPRGQGTPASLGVQTPVPPTHPVLAPDASLLLKVPKKTSVTSLCFPQTAPPPDRALGSRGRGAETGRPSPGRPQFLRAPDPRGAPFLGASGHPAGISGLRRPRSQELGGLGPRSLATWPSHRSCEQRTSQRPLPFADVSTPHPSHQAGPHAAGQAPARSARP